MDCRDLPDRRRLCLAAFALAAQPAGLWAASTHLPKATNLQVLGKQMRSVGEPVVLLATLQGCPYCDWVRRTHLLPRVREKVLRAFELDARDASVIADFAGNYTGAAAWLRSQRVEVMPTVLFFDEAGREVAPRLVGVSIPDFYGAYLDARLEASRRALG